MGEDCFPVGFLSSCRIILNDAVWAMIVFEWSSKATLINQYVYSHVTGRNTSTSSSNTATFLGWAAFLRPTMASQSSFALSPSFVEDVSVSIFLWKKRIQLWTSNKSIAGFFKAHYPFLLSHSVPLRVALGYCKSLIEAQAQYISKLPNHNTHSVHARKKSTYSEARWQGRRNDVIFLNCGMHSPYHLPDFSDFCWLCSFAILDELAIAIGIGLL